MDQLDSCPGCGGNTLYGSRAAAGGGYAPELLPGLGGFFSPATFIVVVCSDCGLTRFYAPPEARAKLEGSKKWSRV